MAAALQITTLVATFALALFGGMFFDSGYFQASIHAKETLGDMPLPGVFSFLSRNHRALGYVMVTPWIIFFVLIPLLTQSKKYSDDDLFLHRSAAFVAIETLITVFLLLFLLLPFLPYYPLMEMRANTVVETSVIFSFWGSVGAISFLCVRRALKNRATREEIGEK